MAKSKKKSVASQSLRETAKARLAAQRPAPAAQAPKAKPARPVASDANEGVPAANDAGAEATTPAAATPATPTAPPKLSALAAAARVLQEVGGAHNCAALIALMAARGYWSSPGGKTPASTLAAAIQREIAAKGPQARSCKTGRGLYAAQTPA